MKSYFRVITKASLAVVVLGLLLGAARTICGQVNSQTAPNRSQPRVIGLSGEMKLGGVITVEVAHLSDWAPGNDPRKLVPFLNGRPLKGVYPEQTDLSGNKLLFHLQHTPESQQVWADLFHEPLLRRPVTVSVGLEDRLPFDTAFDYGNRLGLIIIPKAFGILSLAVILCAVVLFGFLARTTDIIREPGPRPPAGKSKRYNLGRAQTAFWFFLVTIAYLCLWLITGDYNTLTPSVLALIGISGATALGAGLMKKDSGLDGVSQDANSRGPLTSSVGTASAGFWQDILSDVDGYSFHRFQIVAWTMLLGIIFVYSVYHYVAMPNFSGELLVLMGISAATYLGFESLQENVFGRIAAAGRGASTART